MMPRSRWLRRRR